MNNKKSYNELKYLCIIIFIASSMHCFSQRKDSISFETYSDSSDIKHMNDYKNYLNTIQHFISDYKPTYKHYLRKVYPYCDTCTVNCFTFGYDQIKRYDLKTALESNRDSIIFLDLRSKDLKEFPTEILLYKNLKYLDLKSLSKVIYLDSVSDKKEKRKYIKLMNEAYHQYNDRTSVTFHPNTIRSFPKEIAQLDHLVWLRMDGIDICQEEYDKLRKLLPNCYIETGIYEYIGYPEIDKNKTRCKK